MFAHMPIIRDILYGAAERGASLPGMCRQLGISPETLNDSNRTLDLAKAYNAWQVALDATGDDNLGLQLGTATTPSILGIVGHLMQSSGTLREAFRQVCTYSALATDMFHYGMHDRGTETRLTFSPVPAWVRSSPHTAKQAVDQAMSGCLHVFFLISGQQMRPVSAEFTHRQPAQLSRYTQIFGPHLRFRSTRNALVFNGTDLDCALRHHDRALAATFEALARKQLRKRSTIRSFAEEVEEYLQYEFAVQIPSLVVISARMNMSTRTFQRKLSIENVRYRDIAEKVSKKIALTLLSSDNSKISEVARIMGYSEPSAFRRAFKRWKKAT